MSVNRNSRIWFEWAIPRDLRIHNPRLRSPPISMSRSRSQVSAREEMPTSDCSRGLSGRSQSGDQDCDLIHLQKVDQAGQHRFDIEQVPYADEVCDWVNDHNSGFKLIDRLVHRQEVSLQTVDRRPLRMEFQKSFRHPGLKVYPDRAHIADNLCRRFLESEKDTPLSAATGSIDKRGSRSWSSPSRPCRRAG